MSRKLGQPGNRYNRFRLSEPLDVGSSQERETESSPKRMCVWKFGAFLPGYLYQEQVTGMFSQMKV